MCHTSYDECYTKCTFDFQLKTETFRINDNLTCLIQTLNFKGIIYLVSMFQYFTPLTCIFFLFNFIIMNNYSFVQILKQIIYWASSPRHFFKPIFIGKILFFFEIYLYFADQVMKLFWKLNINWIFFFKWIPFEFILRVDSIYLLYSIVSFIFMFNYVWFSAFLILKIFDLFFIKFYLDVSLNWSPWVRFIWQH